MSAPFGWSWGGISLVRCFLLGATSREQADRSLPMDPGTPPFWATASMGGGLGILVWHNNNNNNPLEG